MKIPPFCSSQVQFTTHRRAFLKSMACAGLASETTVASLQSQPSASLAKTRRLDPNAELRVGMIGTSGHTELVLSALPKISGARLVAYAMKDGQRLQTEVAKSQNADTARVDIERLRANHAFRSDTKIHETYQEMFSREKLDVVGVCLPYSINAFASIAAAERGIHVMSEKPLATQLRDLEKLQQIAGRSGVQVSAMLEMRLSPGIRTIREAIAKGLIGEPVLATGQKSYKFGETRPWFYKTRQTYGGTIPWIGIHAIDFILYTTGLKVKQAAAMQGNKSHPEYPGMEDQAGILLGLSNGGTAVVTLDYFRPETASGHGDDRLRVVGTQGVIEMLGDRVELMTREAAARALPLLPQLSLFADFVAFLRGQGPHVLGPGEAFEVTRVCLLARQAADEKRVIEV